jgi:outer membrane lipoprotein-sorting protein
MKPEQDIAKFIKNAGLNINPDAHERIFRDVLGNYKQIGKNNSADLQPGYWRIIMTTRIAKLAMAAVIIAAVTLGVSIFLKTESSAWAIEQSIEAIARYKAVFTEGFQSPRLWKKDGGLELLPAKTWAVENQDQTKVEKCRMEIEGFFTLTTNGQKTWRYDPKINTVSIENRPYMATELGISQMLEQLKELRDTGKYTFADWEETYGKDPASGRERAYLSFALTQGPFSPRSMWFEFDAESKLLIGYKQWGNSSMEGTPLIVVEKITYYETLPDDLFEFEIPEGATVIESK